MKSRRRVKEEKEQHILKDLRAISKNLTYVIKVPEREVKEWERKNICKFNG